MNVKLTQSRFSTNRKSIVRFRRRSALNSELGGPCLPDPSRTFVAVIAQINDFSGKDELHSASLKISGQDDCILDGRNVILLPQPDTLEVVALVKRNRSKIRRPHLEKCLANLIRPAPIKRSAQ
jgi:hypothetical protein